jgi:hypothetical protein
MSASNQLAVYLPFILAIALVGFTIAGSRMGAKMRLRMQRFVLMPLLALVGAGAVWLAVVQHDYSRAGILFLMIVMTLPRLFARPAASSSRGQAQ